MKNLIRKNILLLGVAGTLAFGCDSKLDIAPDNTIESGQALETSSDVEALLVGAYNELGDEDFYAGNLLRNAELIGLTDELFWDGTFVAPGQIYNKAILVNNDQARDMWIAGYEAVNITNNVLANMEVVDADQQGRVEGEAKFIRATVYFELVRLYGKTWVDGDPNSNLGVPLITTPTDVVNEESYVSRASVADVYAQVISDLQDAASLLPESNSFFATQGAAQAMLSRVYLMQQDYESAAAMANNVISSGAFSLNASYAACFNNGTNTAEDIFAMQVSSQDGTNNMNTFFASSANAGRGDIDITEEHLALYEEGDARLGLFYEDAGTGDIRTGKWNNQFGNVNIIRFAEMYLTRAEANFRLGTSLGAAPLEDINVIRARVGLAPLAALTLDDILLERHLELAFEGHAIHDVKRIEGMVGALPYTAPNLVFPIPQRELDANPGLQGQQNEGYATN